MRAACVAVVLAVAGLLTVSCNGLVDPSNNVTETFSGSVSPQGYDFHLFSVSKNGEITIKVTALAPIDNQPIGLIWAQSSGAACDGQVLQSAAASLNQPSPIVGQIFQGTYCVLVYDLGIFSAAETYTVSVSHP